MNYLRQSIKQILTRCVPSRWLLTRGPRRPMGKAPRLALTFDDGPHPVHTSRLLDLLQAYQLQGTFFAIGKNANEFPGLVQRIADAGHELGNHTWSHSEPSQTSPSLFLDEVRWTDSLLRDLTGATPKTMRPPKGELNPAKLRGLWQQRKNVALWNVDPRDYRMTCDADVSAWASNYEPQDGDVLLFHDNHPWASSAITQLANRGIFNRFETVCVSTLVGMNQCPRPPLAVTAGGVGETSLHQTKAFSE